MLIKQTRYERGQALATLKPSPIRKILPRTTKAQLWKVQSQSHKEIEYNVIFNNDELTCDCKDFELHHETDLCKHIYAVLISEVD